MLCGLCNHARGESESGCSNPLLDAGKAVLLDVAGLPLHAGQAVPRQVNRSQLSSRQEFAPGLVADYCLWYPAANGQFLPFVKGRSPSKPASRIQRVLLGELCLY